MLHKVLIDTINLKLRCLLYAQARTDLSVVQRFLTETLASLPI